MQLLKFECYTLCPMCRHTATGAYSSGCKTRYCERTHTDVRPFLDITVNGAAPAPHLHRTCERCDYEWLERTAAEQSAIDAGVK